MIWLIAITAVIVNLAAYYLDLINPKKGNLLAHMALIVFDVAVVAYLLYRLSKWLGGVI